MQGRVRKRRTKNKASEEVVYKKSLVVMRYPHDFSLITLTFLSVNHRLKKILNSSNMHDD